MYKYEPELSTNIEISRQNKKIIFSVLTKKRCVKNRSPEQLLKILLSERGKGKTTQLIKKSAETGAIIVEPTATMCEEVKRKAAKMELEIPAPITIHDFITSQWFGARGHHFFIDELQMVLPMLNIDLATANMDSVEELQMETPKEPMWCKDNGCCHYNNENDKRM